jgi:ornithine decarboxylase
MCNILNETLDKNFPYDSGVEIMAEPGRFFASASYTLATIITTKKICIKENVAENCKSGAAPVPFSKDGPNKVKQCVKKPTKGFWTLT